MHIISFLNGKVCGITQSLFLRGTKVFFFWETHKDIIYANTLFVTPQFPDLKILFK